MRMLGTQEVGKNTKKERVEKFIEIYLAEKFAFFMCGLECSLLKHFPGYNHECWIVRIIALRDAVKEIGIWEKFNQDQENKRNIDRISEDCWVKEYWNKGIKKCEGDNYQYYNAVKESIKDDLMLLRSLS